MLPVTAALVILLLLLPIFVIPVNALTPSVGKQLKVVTIPEDDEKRNKGIMVLGINPEAYENELDPLDHNWYTDSACTQEITTIEYLGPMVSSTEPVVADEGFLVERYYRAFTVTGVACELYTFLVPWVDTGKGYAPGWDLLSQHKILVTLDGVPTAPTYTLCEIVEKEKLKIPPQDTKTPSIRQFPDEDIKTTLIDVSSNFVCKFRWIKPGVGVLDVYFVGPQITNFIADHMLIVTVGVRVGSTTVWASDLQDICILGWSMDENFLGIVKFLPYRLSEGWYEDMYWSWPDPLYYFTGCEEAALWQLTWTVGGWPWGIAVEPYPGLL